MSLPQFSFKHQKSPSTRSSTLGDVSISRNPIVIDFSSTYTNNQETAISVDAYPVVGGEISVSGILGDLVVTDKLLDDGTFLFYEHQLMFDAAGSGVTVVDSEGEAVRHKIEYARIEPTSAGSDISYPLVNHSELDYDPLSGHSEIGLPVGSVTFAPMTTPSGQLPYKTHADSLAIGTLRFPAFNGSPLPYSGLIDFTFLSTDGSTYLDTVYADDWSVLIGSGQVALRVNSTTSSVISIDDNTWYRGRVKYNVGGSTTLEVRRDTLIGSKMIAEEIEPSGFCMSAVDSYLNNLVLYSHFPTYDWNVPPVAPRYHHSLRWDSSPVSNSDPFRMRVLTEEGNQSFIIYDAYKPGGIIQQNRMEPMNLVPIYKESVIEDNDWDRFSDRLILSGPLADATTVYVKPVVEGLISVGVVNNNVVVTDGSFRSDSFDEGTGKYSYELLEYDDMMPFEVDNQNIVIPKSLKEVKMRAEVVSAYKIKVLPMNVFEGRYPSYLPEQTKDVVKVVQDGVVVSTVGDVQDVTWRKTRGIRVYINGVQISQDLIRNIDLNNGIIFLNQPVRPEDNVEVTFLRRVKYFICNYPRIKPELVSGMSWRIYLRSMWPNYFLDRPTDTLERLAYRTMVNGTPVGDLKSCTSDQEVDEVEGTIHLADISMVPSITFSDARSFGGGILPDSYFGSGALRRSTHKHSIYFADIARYHSSSPSDASNFIPWPSIIIRIPSRVRLAIEGRFNDSNTALVFIKKTIEKHLALGTYYIIVDENNDLWDNPFPLNSPLSSAMRPRIEKI